MYSHTEEAHYIDDEFGEIPIEFKPQEPIVRFLNTNAIKKGKLKRKAFHPYNYPKSGECRLSVHRLEYSTIEYARKIAINTFHENYRGIAVLQINHILNMNCTFETCPENNVTQHAHIIYPEYEHEIGKPLKAEIMDIIDGLYQFVKKHQLFFPEKIDNLTEIVLPDEFPKIEQ